MRVAYVSVNRESLPDAVIPIGLLYLMAATPDRHEKLLLDLCFEAEPLAFLAAGLAGFQPDVVAIGIRNLQNMDYTNMSANLDFCRRVVATVRANSTARIVLGGLRHCAVSFQVHLHATELVHLYGPAVPAVAPLLEQGGAG